MEFKYKEWMENAGKLVRKIPLTHRDKNGTREEVSTGRLEIIRKELGLYAAETLKLLPEIIEEFRTVGRNLYTVKEYIEEQNTLAKEFDRLSQFEFSVDDTKEIQTVLEPKIQELIPINNKIKKSVQEELLLVEKMRKDEEYLENRRLDQLENAQREVKKREDEIFTKIKSTGVTDQQIQAAAEGQPLPAEPQKTAGIEDLKTITNKIISNVTDEVNRVKHSKEIAEPKIRELIKKHQQKIRETRQIGIIMQNIDEAIHEVLRKQTWFENEIRSDKEYLGKMLERFWDE